MDEVFIAELNFVEEALGSSVTSHCLKIDEAEFVKLKNRQAETSSMIEERVTILRLIILKLQQVFDEKVVFEWFLGTNPVLGKFRPIDLIVNDRWLEVLGAVDQAKAGSYS